MTFNPLSSDINYDFLVDACEKALCEFAPSPEAIAIVKMIDGFDPGRVIEKLIKIYDLNKIKILIQVSASYPHFKEFVCGNMLRCLFLTAFPNE